MFYKYFYLKVYKFDKRFITRSIRRKHIFWLDPLKIYFIILNIFLLRRFISNIFTIPQIVRALQNPILLLFLSISCLLYMLSLLFYLLINVNIIRKDKQFIIITNYCRFIITNFGIQCSHKH